MQDLPGDVEIAFTLKADPDPGLGEYVLAFEGQATAWDDEIGDDRPVGHIRGHRCLPNRPARAQGNSTGFVTAFGRCTRPAPSNHAAQDATRCPSC
jgi:hypothetical protein